jgi:tol-pal system protein YbgF
MRTPIILAGILPAALIALSAAAASDPALEARVARLEETLGNQTAAGLLIQVQRLQQEVQELRGMVEVQQYKINALTGGQPMPADGSDQVQPPAPFPDTYAPMGFATEGPKDIDDTSSAQRSIDTLDLRTVAPSRLPVLPAPETTAGSEREVYKAAFDLLKERRYAEAQAAFRDVLARYPQGQYADNARYWLAETSYTTRDYPTALMEFEALVREYPRSPKVVGALLKIGYIQYEQQDWPAARATLEGLIRRFPESTEARLAKSRLERMTKEGR